MPRSNQGGGPWGSGGKGRWGSGPPSSGPTPPDLEELLRRSQDRMKSYIPGGFGSARGVAIVIILVVAGWMLTGFYTVQPSEVGSPWRFGGRPWFTDAGHQGHLHIGFGGPTQPGGVR